MCSSVPSLKNIVFSQSMHKNLSVIHAPTQVISLQKVYDINEGSWFVYEPLTSVLNVGVWFVIPQIWSTQSGWTYVQQFILFLRPTAAEPSLM